MTTKLAHQTQRAVGIGNGMRTATIAAVSGNVVTLSVNGGLFSSGVGVLDSYTPQVGDTVAVFRQDSSWLVMGAISPPASGLSPRNIQTGTTLVSFASAASNAPGLAVLFPVPFPVAPVVHTNIDSGAIGKWTTHAINTTTVGFSIFAISTDGVVLAWSNVPVSWTATARS